MTKISLKSAKRKTQVSRAKVRSIMTRLFAQSQADVVKTTASKPVARKKV